jgi:hypothetical protein
VRRRQQRESTHDLFVLFDARKLEVLLHLRRYLFIFLFPSDCAWLRLLFYPLPRPGVLSAMEKNILDGLLDLEEEFYQEGYNLGATDGAQAGYTEGSVFAVEKGFEKFVELGRLYGKALVWAQRLADSDSPRNSSHESDETDTGKPQSHSEDDLHLDPFVCKEMLPLPPSSRLAKNLEILLELVDPASLPMDNTEEAVTDVDERLKGATIKAKLIQRALGEREDTSDIHPDAKDAQVAGDGTGSIEDISSLNIRH